MTGALYAAAGSDPALLVEVAREFSPRIEAVSYTHLRAHET